MKAIGLEPMGADGSYVQNVPMRSVTPIPGFTDLKFRYRGGQTRLELGRAIVASTYRAAGEYDIDAPLVFAGYGVTAPEHEWDDFGGVDVKGKVLVVLVGDPPVTDGRFGGKAMTYYGRWTYKFDKALELGAAGCFVVHEDGPASYGWNVVQTGWTDERFDIVDESGELPPALDVQGWLSAAAADRLAKRAGASLEGWHKQALEPGFRPVVTGVRLRGTVRTEERRVEDVNIAGRIKGRDKPTEAVILTAHWDHLGIASGAKAGEDRIYNGALDNASGTATLLGIAAEMAKRAKAGDRPARSIVFLAVTAEEQGLLGSKYYVADPLVPLAETAGVINLDSVNVGGRTKNIQVIGMGQSTLEDVLAEVAKKQGREVVGDERPERGSYYRSDHFSFARRGVPAIYFRGGKDMESGGIEAGQRLAEANARNYHTVGDEFDPGWSFEGAVQDGEAMLDVARRVADAESRPAWRPASEFAKVPR